MLGRASGSRRPRGEVHPNDDVNRGQFFPTAMHVAAVEALRNHTLPRVAALPGQLVLPEKMVG